MRKWIASRIFGLTEAPDATLIDISRELRNGKSVLIDSSVTSPVQRHLRNITSRGNFTDTPTVELCTYANKDNLTTFSDLQEAKVRHQIEAIKQSMLANKKTVIQINRSLNAREQRTEERMLEAIVETAEKLWINDRKLPLFVIELLWRYENEYILELIKRLQDIGTTLVFRLVELSMPSSAMTADIHIVERVEFRKYLRSDAEVMLSSGERAVIASHEQARRFSKWDYKAYNFDRTPSVTEYDESFCSRPRREAFVRKHWGDLGVALNRC